MKDTWKERAHSTIRECYLVWLDITGIHPSPSMSDKDKKQLLQMIRAAYPFGERAMWPYKVWCAEVRKVKAFLYPVQSSVDSGLFSEEPV